MKFLPKTVDAQFLVRVIKNEVSPEEREYFEKWIEYSDENKEEFSSTLLLWDQFQYSHLPSLPSQQDQWAKISSVISHFDLPSSEPAAQFIPEKETRIIPFEYSSALNWIYRIAAVVVLGVALYLLVDSVKFTQPSAIVKKEAIEADIKYYSIVTAKGEKATITLGDNSVIQLNASSKLRYPDRFGLSSREVQFEGEAYFKIAHDKTRPFRVKCINAVTEVTGTEFNIHNRENKFSITVVEGSVKTFSSRVPEGVPVKRGEMVSLRSSGDFTKPVKVNLAHFPAWRENKIKFSRTPLTEAASELQRCFEDINIVILSDSIRAKTITGIFSTRSLDDILSIFNLTLDIRITKNGNMIYFE